MIEKVKMEDRGKTFCFEDLIIAMAKKQDEIIDKVNELDIKLHTVKYFTPSQEKGVKELLELLEKDDSVGDVVSEDKSYKAGYEMCLQDIREHYKKLNITDVEPWSIYKINGSWLFELERMLNANNE